MNADKVNAIATAIESKLGNDAYDEAERDLIRTIEALGRGEFHLTAIGANTSIRLVHSLVEIAEYRHLLTESEIEETYEAAQRLLTRAMELFNDHPSVINEQGLLYFSKSHYDKALEEFKRVIALPATHHMAVTEVAFQWASAACRRLFRFGEAEQLVSQAANHFSTEAKGVAIERAWLEHDHQNYRGASIKFDDVLTSDPRNESALLGKLCCLHSIGIEAARGILVSLRKSTASHKILTMLSKCLDIHEERAGYAAQLIAIDQMIELDPENPYLLQTHVEVLRDLRKYSEAEVQCREYLALFPKYPGLRLALGWTWYDQQRYKEAHDEFTHPLLRENKVGIEWAITTLRWLNRLDEAKARIEPALNQFPDSAGLWSEKGVLFVADRRYKEAIATFERALTLDERDGFAVRFRIASYRKLKEFDRANQLMSQALELQPNNAELHGEQGWLLFDQDRGDEAVVAFRKATEMNPYLVYLAFGRSEVLARLGRGLEARQILQDLSKRFPRDGEVEERLGWLLISQNEPFEARRTFNAILSWDSNDVRGINGMGGFYLNQNDYEAAETQFREAIKRVDGEPQYHVYLAWALLGQANDLNTAPHFDLFSGVRKISPTLEDLLSKAEQSCQRALELDQFNAKAMGCLGVIAFKRRRFQEAEDYFRSSIRADSVQGSRTDLAALYTHMGRHEDAETLLYDAIRLNEKDARALVELASLLAAKEQYGKSITICRRALLLNPNSDEGYRALAILLMRAGKYAEAETVLRSAIRLVDESRRWKLHLILSEVLVRLGDDDNRNRDLYEDGLRQVRAARRVLENNDEIHFHDGVIHFKLQDYRSARKSFEKCVKSNPLRFDAERNITVIKHWLRESRRVNRINIWGGISLAVVCVLGLFGIWFLFLTGWLDKIDSKIISFMTPLLLGLTIVALLLPNLNKLKLPGGFEAEISAPALKEISTGPKGEIGFGSSQETISTGPR